LVSAGRDTFGALRAVANAGNAFFRGADRNLAGIGLSFREFQALMTLAESGQLSMVDLANDLNITQAGTTSVVDRLEGNGLVERVRSKKDRRVINIRVTGKGRKTFEQALRVYKSFIERTFSPLTDQEVGLLAVAFDKIRKGAETAQETGSVAPAARKSVRRRATRG